MAFKISSTIPLSPPISIGAMQQPVQPSSMACCASDGSIGGGGTGSSSGTGSPPPPPPRGMRFSTADQALLTMLQHRLPMRKYPLYDIALSRLIDTRDAMQGGTAADTLLRATVFGMTSAIEQEMSFIPPSEWPDIASAIYLLGRMHFMLASSTQSQLAELLTGAALFVQHVDAHRDRQDGMELAVQDQVLAAATMPLLGGVTSIDMTAGHKAALAAPIHRMAIASGSIVWPARGASLSRLPQALSKLYPGVDASAFHDANLLPPSVYTGATWRLRPKPMGLLEHIIATYLGDSADAALRYCHDSLFESAMLPATGTARNGILAEMGSILGRELSGNEGRTDALRALVYQCYTTQDTRELRRNFSLISFLKDALES